MTDVIAKVEYPAVAVDWPKDLGASFKIQGGLPQVPF